MNKNIPFEKGLPLIGNLIPYSKDRLGWLENLSKKNGEIFQVKIGNKKLYVTVGKEYVRHIMMGNFNNYIKVTNFDEIFGNSLFTTNGKEWKRQRQLLTPLMNIKYLENCLSKMDEIIDSNLRSFENSPDNGENIRVLFSKITFDIIMSCIIGADYEQNFQHIDKAVGVLTRYVTDNKYLPFKIPRFLDKAKKEFDFYLNKVDEVIYQSIQNTDPDEDSFSYLHQLLKFRKSNPEEKITDQFIRDNIVTVMFAGYETSSLTLAFLMDLLLESPEWLNQCIEEANAVEGNFTVETLNNLPVLKACLFEAMRLYPTGWGFTRIAVQGEKVNGQEFNAGDIFLVSPYLTQRSPMYWESPEKFDPSRFLHQKLTEEMRQIYFPFGMGPRTCSGMQMANMEMMLILVRIFQKYNIKRTGKRPVVDARATLESKNGFIIKMEKRC